MGRFAVTCNHRNNNWSSMNRSHQRSWQPERKMHK
jgi:hypothetical protein